MFVVGIAFAVVLTFRHGLNWPLSRSDNVRAQDAAIVLQHAGNPDTRQAVDVIRIIDGDTFLARLHQRDGRDLVTRVRLRGIDAPELKASCQDELTKAEAATDALRELLGQGGVAIYNIGPDKYEGRVVADVATRRTANVRCSRAAMSAATMAAIATAGAREAGDSGNEKVASKRGFPLSADRSGQRVTTTVVPTDTRE